MKLLCKQLGGSHSYGLNTPASDIDYRGVFINTDLATVIGLDKHEHQITQNNSADESYTEFRNALHLLRNANTQMVELLYAKDWLEISDEWKAVIENRKELVSSEKLFSCLRGYMQGELRLANGERTGKLGGKRKDAIDKYGFSPKNFVQLFRLAWAGSIYFKQGYFPVNVTDSAPSFAQTLMAIKTTPQTFTKETLNAMATQWDTDLVKAFENRAYDTKFNEQLANKLCLLIYRPIINNL
jgi:predicted nucleotidyltransferase